ncbi:MAG: peptidoglycan DD-metalloendopeptidase family protein [Salibacteraceae bacterium]|nr:peptidoglycan DD-metalloendopeptidase family protein [Salibacteraceae bacterium]MDP4685907.1 peptidoglycan DD-metalloendopeptidase family protein [Salibacteraceae bacterium]MDP4762874.1 peptidoglycan DD-metalloendopeptidase family protein [Salibacteraceae bacterium]MDP4843120.1 peptidoglycan DD-metalloendopeptidase family protein [Salibacteraceae bacterium]MDP4934109.1 peptidoglycan DD-metalloendopeptidase family protein [Salibacteraceae bacterium]
MAGLKKFSHHHLTLKELNILFKKTIIALATAIVLFGVVNTYISSQEFTNETQMLEKVDHLNAEECTEEFGIDLKGFHVEKGKIQPNQFLAEILLPYNIDYQEITKLASKAKTIFDIRKLNAGKNYTLISTDDSLQKAQFFIYEVSAIDYVVYDLRDTMRVYHGARPVVLEERTAAGLINSSLYQTLIDQELSPALAMELADIYAWSIDFYRIQKGDFFKVIYQVKKVNNQVVGVDEITAALFQHQDVPFYAFQFSQNEGPDYFDEQGLSLRKAFLQAPLKFSRISSGYTQRRFHPVQKRWKAHLGTDYAAPTGTPIMTVGDGVVLEAKYSQYNGNYVKVKHNQTYTTQYLHMSKIASNVKTGTRVKQGQVIGYVGSTGLATGPHVCFRFWKNGTQVDHRNEKIPPSEPIKAEFKEAFEMLLAKEKARLDNIGLAHDTKREVASLSGS